jgi:hypothetical protein
MEPTIETAEMSEIKAILEDRGMTENQLRVSRQRLIKVLNTDLIYMGIENRVKPIITIAEVREVPICKFTKWCRLRRLNEDTILKLIEKDIIDVYALSYIGSSSVDQFNIAWGQRELLRGIIIKEFESKRVNGNREDFSRTRYRLETQKGPKLELWNDSKLSFLEWLKGVEWKLEASDPLRKNWKPTIISLLTGEAREIAIEIKKMSEKLTYDWFRQLLVAKMNDESAKARVKMELSRMTYSKDTDVEEYVEKMVMLLKAKTPEIKEATLCEEIMDRLPAWAQDGVRICGVSDTIKDLIIHMLFTNRAQQRREEELERIRNQMETRKALGKFNRSNRKIYPNFEGFKKKFESKTKENDNKRVGDDGKSSSIFCVPETETLRK